MDEMQANRPTVIYVTGLAYSGTTLFSSALGSSENIFNAGEINYLENDYHPNKVCSCGQKVADCEVWRPVLELVENQSKKETKTLTFSREQTLREIDKRYKPLKTKVLTLFGVQPERLYKESELVDYGLRHQNFLRTLASSVDVDFIVDASKSFTRLHVLNHYTDLNIHVIYVRRSLIQSYASRLKRAKRRNRLYTPLFAPVYLTVIFIRVQGLRRRLEKLAFENVSIVDYETFVEDPEFIEAQLSREIGTPVDLGIEENKFSLDHLHVFTGNIWLAQAAKTGKSVVIKSGDGRSTLSWFERQSFRVLRPVFELFQ